MISSGRWLMQTTEEPDNCWACDQWGFTLFFWNENMGKANERNKIGIDTTTKDHLVNTIKMQNQDSYMENQSYPVMFSNLTNWKPKPFWRLLDFLNSVEPCKEPDYEKIAKKDAMDKYNFSNMKELPTNF